MIQVAKIIGTGLATTGLIGAGVGIGVVFGALILGVSKDLSLGGQLFSYAILGFAFAEATGLFALMMEYIKGSTCRVLVLKATMRGIAKVKFMYYLIQKFLNIGLGLFAYTCPRPNNFCVLNLESCLDCSSVWVEIANYFSNLNVETITNCSSVIVNGLCYVAQNTAIALGSKSIITVKLLEEAILNPSNNLLSGVDPRAVLSCLYNSMLSSVTAGFSSAIHPTYLHGVIKTGAAVVCSISSNEVDYIRLIPLLQSIPQHTADLLGYTLLSLR